MQTILHPTDFSKHSMYAFEVACSLGLHYHVPVHILHVAAPSVVIEGEAMIAPSSKEYLAECKEKMRNMGACTPDVITRYELVEGEPVEEILRVSRKIQPGFIVMGTHGRSALQRLLMGSVAEKVVRRS